MERTWDGELIQRLADVLHGTLPAAEARRTLRAFEVVVTIARAEPALLPDLLAAAATLVAVADGETPRTVADNLFRRAVSDDDWREVYLPIFS